MSGWMETPQLYPSLKASIIRSSRVFATFFFVTWRIPRFGKLWEINWASHTIVLRASLRVCVREMQTWWWSLWTAGQQCRFLYRTVFPPDCERAGEGWRSAPSPAGPPPGPDPGSYRSETHAQISTINICNFTPRLTVLRLNQAHYNLLWASVRWIYDSLNCSRLMSVRQSSRHHWWDPGWSDLHNPLEKTSKSALWVNFPDSYRHVGSAAEPTIQSQTRLPALIF